jgi:hypothetical protein
MAAKKKLSDLAKQVFKEHFSCHQPGVGGGSGFKTLGNEKDHTRAYKELVDAGLLELDGGTLMTGAGKPILTYRLTEKGKQGLLTDEA